MSLCDVDGFVDDDGNVKNAGDDDGKYGLELKLKMLVDAAVTAARALSTFAAATDIAAVAVASIGDRSNDGE